MGAPDKTQQIAVDAVGNPESVTPNSPCTVIVVFEAQQAGTVAFGIRRPLMTSARADYAAGTKATVRPADGRRTFVPGQVAFYIETLSGSANFNIIEDCDQ